MRERLMLALLLSMPAYPQAVPGLSGITGVVRDATGVAIANAEVTILNGTKGIERHLTTNSAGAFAAPSLVPSSGYTVIISKAGFAKREVLEIELQVGQNLTVDATLFVEARWFGLTFRIPPSQSIKPARTSPR